jgi:hypothetical protein
VYFSFKQQMNRISLATLLHLLFSPTALFFNSILASRIPNVFGSKFGFARHTSPTLPKTKRANFSHRTGHTIQTKLYI